MVNDPIPRWIFNLGASSFEADVFRILSLTIFHGSTRMVWLLLQFFRDIIPVFFKLLFSITPTFFKIRLGKRWMIEAFEIQETFFFHLY
jgi:hypothetical protein